MEDSNKTCNKLVLVACFRKRELIIVFYDEKRIDSLFFFLLMMCTWSFSIGWKNKLSDWPLGRKERESRYDSFHLLSIMIE